MTKEQVLELIKNQRDKLINPVEMLDWTYLYVFVNQIPEGEFDKYMEKAAEVCSR